MIDISVEYRELKIGTRCEWNCSSLEALKAKIDIVDVVGSYLELKKNGGNFKACCPFHGGEDS